VDEPKRGGDSEERAASIIVLPDSPANPGGNQEPEETAREDPSVIAPVVIPATEETGAGGADST